MTAAQTMMADLIGHARTARSSNSDVVELHVATLQQLFDVLDPRPCREHALDARAHEFIVESSRALPRRASLSLLIHLDRPAGLGDEQGVLRDAVHGYFRERADASRQRLRRLFHVGRMSLLIGLGFLAMAVAASELLDQSPYDAPIAVVLRETIIIGGWVAMWRPLEIFLYDWWPIRGEVRLLDRLAAMPVRINHGSRGPSNAWQSDWPAAQSVPPRIPSTESPRASRSQFWHSSVSRPHPRATSSCRLRRMKTCTRCRHTSQSHITRCQSVLRRALSLTTALTFSSGKIRTYRQEEQRFIKEG